MNRTCLVLIACLVFRLAGVQAAGNPEQAIAPVGTTVRKVNCADCHTCSNPTKKDPCLAPCPRSITNSGPDVVLLDQLSMQYVPVIFAHKLHAQMTEIGGGCAVCHHFNPSHRILACRECHSASNPEDLAKPGLKGAYHRQCLNCHREWSHETECAVCHAKKTADSAAVVLPDPTDIMGILHPNVEEPITKIYDTKYEHGRLVTFRHQEHVQRFGFKCAGCHREQNCSRCHTLEKGVVRPKSLNEHHSPCSTCHEIGEEKTERCLHCHSNKETPPFTHERTGLVLDDSHKDAACFECHINSKFKQRPVCSGCHEEQEKISYPEKLPGKKVKTS